MNVLDIILLIIGVYLIILGFVANTTSDFKSKFFIKVMPFVCGVYCVVYSLVTSGIISLNM